MARLLIVEDHPINLELARALLDAAGHEVVGAADADAARRALAAARPELILMDIQLPGIDGLALAAELRADPALAAVPIVALTAYAMAGDEARFLAAGCQGYISKPIDIDRFASQVQACLERGVPGAP